jgi:hypothetical protein
VLTIVPDWRETRRRQDRLALDARPHHLKLRLLHKPAIWASPVALPEHGDLAPRRVQRPMPHYRRWNAIIGFSLENFVGLAVALMY